MKGLNALLGIVSTPHSAPVIAAARLRKSSTNSARGAARFVTNTRITARKAGASRPVVLRADSAHHGHATITAALRHGAYFSITAGHDKAVRTSISTIGEDAWTPKKYTHAIFDEASRQWISDAQVAEVPYTAFTSKPKAEHITARLVVRRVTDMNPDNQSALFTAYRHHAVFTQHNAADAGGRESPPRPRDRRADHHRPENRALAHLPSGHFWANTAWLVCATKAFTLTRATGVLASNFHAPPGG